MLKTRLTKIGTALGLALAMLIGTFTVATPAYASFLCRDYLVCGDVYYAQGSPSRLLTTCDWNNPWGSTDWVYKGEWSSCRDVDGFRLPAGCSAVDWSRNASYASKGWSHWVKIDDANNARISLYC